MASPEAQGSIRPAELPELPDDHHLLRAEVPELAAAILSKLEDPDDRLMLRQLHYLCATIQSRLNGAENRFSISYVRELVGTFYGQISPEYRPNLSQASVVEFGSGNENPYAVGLAFLALGASSFAAVDAAPLLDQALANHSLASLAMTLVLDSEQVLGQDRVSSETVLARLSDLGIESLLTSDSQGLNSPRLRYLQESCTETSLRDQSVDFGCSSAFLEHVPLDATARELHRVTKPGGIHVHNIDFSDHGIYDGVTSSPIAFLLEQPESEFVRTCNRVRLSGVRESFERAGFETLKVHSYEHRDPTSQELEGLVPPFDRLSDEDLRTLGAVYVLRRPS